MKTEGQKEAQCDYKIVLQYGVEALTVNQPCAMARPKSGVTRRVEAWKHFWA